jgi:hypothetical protein
MLADSLKHSKQLYCIRVSISSKVEYLTSWSSRLLKAHQLQMDQLLGFAGWRKLGPRLLTHPQVGSTAAVKLSWWGLEP